jgi:hypothetical protein
MPAAASAPAQSAATQPVRSAATQPAGLPSVESATPGPFHLDELTFDLGFDARYQRRNVISDPPGQRPFRQLDEERGFAETIGGYSSGTLFGERVAQFDVGARWGLTQEHYYERRPGSNLTEDPDGNLLEYDFSVNLLPAGKISALLFGSQLDDRIPRPFLPSLDRTRERYGATLLFNDATLPMRLTFEHLFDDITSDQDRLDNERFFDDRFDYEATWQINDHHALRLEYQYDDSSERYSGLRTSFDTRRNYFTLDHTLDFGSDYQHSLDTLVRLQNEAGNLAQDIAEVSPRLRLQHTPSLATTYAAQYLEDNFENVHTRQWRGEVGLIHQLGDTLTSTFDLFGLKQDFEDLAARNAGTDVTDWGGVTNFALAKDNALGRFTGNFAYTHNRVHSSGDRRDAVVVAESVTFRDPLPAYLAHDDVVNWSIVVTDPSRTRIYVSGRDYVIVRRGRLTALVRVPSGHILDGGTVLVTYRYRGFDSYELSRDRMDWRLQQDFKNGLTLYYAAALQDEDLTHERFQPFEDRNIDRQRIGAQFRRPRWSVGSEFEYNDGTIEQFNAMHFNGDAVAYEDARQQLSGRARLSRFWFDDVDGSPAHNTTLLDTGVSYTYLLAPDLEASGTALYRFESDSIFGRTNGVDLSANVAYTLGLISLLLEVEYDVLDLPESSDNTFAVWLKLRREIPVIGAPRGPQWSTRSQ